MSKSALSKKYNCMYEEFTYRNEQRMKLRSVVERLIEKKQLVFDSVNLGENIIELLDGNSRLFSDSIVNSITDEEFDCQVRLHEKQTGLDCSSEEFYISFSLVMLLTFSLSLKFREKVISYQKISVSKINTLHARRKSVLERLAAKSSPFESRLKENIKITEIQSVFESNSKKVSQLFSEIEKGIIISILMEICEKDGNGAILKSHYIANIAECLCPKEQYRDNYSLEVAIGYQMKNLNRKEIIKEWKPIKRLFLEFIINNLLIYQENYIKGEVNRSIDLMKYFDMDLSKVALLRSLID